VALGDFNGDGHPDILGQNKMTGNLYVWYMNGTTITGGVSITGTGDLTWEAVGIADFNKDGKLDILWRNYAAGQNAVWFMNGTSKTDSTGLTSVDTSWEKVGPK
jgi:hypothetical protein